MLIPLIAALLAQAPLPPKAPPGHSMAARAADLNGDGIQDLFVAMEREPNRLLIGTRAGGFADASANLPRAARDSEDAALFDADGDGDLDIAVANEDDLLPELYLNDGRGRFTDASARLAHRVKANAVVAFDADRDGHPDLFFGGDKVSSLWMGDGRGGFRDESIARLPATFGGTQHVAVLDADGDGDPDLALGNEDRNQLYLNDGRGRFSLAPAAALPRLPAEETRDIETLDADGDGRPDLLLANVALWNPRATPGARLLLNNGDGTFRDASDRLPPTTGNILSALATDLDGDGRPDLVLTAADLSRADPSGPVRAWLNRGGRFEDATARYVPAGLATAGFDATAITLGDGRRAIFISGRAMPDVLLVPAP